MKARKSEIDSLIDLLLYSFKNNTNLPFKIPTMTCPDLKPSKNLKRKYCRKRHSEIVVQSYLPEEKKYRLLYYGMHTTKDVYMFDQEEQIVKQIIKKSLLKEKYGGKKLLEIRSIKKLLGKRLIKYNKVIRIRISQKQYNSLVSKVGNRNLGISDYVRLKLFP